MATGYSDENSGSLPSTEDLPGPAATYGANHFELLFSTDVRKLRQLSKEVSFPVVPWVNLKRYLNYIYGRIVFSYAHIYVYLYMFVHTLKTITGLVLYMSRQTLIAIYQ